MTPDREALSLIRQAETTLRLANGGRSGNIRQRREDVMNKLHEALHVLASANEEKPKLEVVK